MIWSLFYKHNKRLNKPHALIYKSIPHFRGNLGRLMVTKFENVFYKRNLGTRSI